MKAYDRIIIGGGIFGLYSALKSAEKGFHVLLLEREKDLFQRASFVNQARVHCGMHYLRAVDTAKLCAKYYNRFIEEHRMCINNSFKAIYANASINSQVSDCDFKRVLESLNLKFQYVETPSFLDKSSVTICAEVIESTFDYRLLLFNYLNKIIKYENLVEIHCGEEVVKIEPHDNIAIVNDMYQSSFILNSTYASVNNVISCIMGTSNKDLYDLRYELCEVVLCEVDEPLRKIGLTIMDGPFFSIMPFGNSGRHSLTSVGHTPLYSSEELFPHFPCQNLNCHSHRLGLCNMCDNKPKSCFEKMIDTVSAFIKKSPIKYKNSLYIIKPILKSSESNDSRPTKIVRHLDSPLIYSVLSGKISSIYELDSIL